MHLCRAGQGSTQKLIPFWCALGFSACYQNLLITSKPVELRKDNAGGAMHFYLDEIDAMQAMDDEDGAAKDKVCHQKCAG